jgi:hypothetical protein
VRTLAASVPVVASVLLVGGLADFADPYSRTAFALGVLACIPGFLIAAALESRWSGR